MSARPLSHWRQWCWYGAGLLTLIVSAVWISEGTRNSSSVERTWTVVAAYGLVFSAWLTVSGWFDLDAVLEAIRAMPPRARAWGPRWWVGLSSVVANGLLCLVWAGFITIGLIAMQFPPPPPNPDQQVSNMWAGWVLIAMEAILAGVQAWHLFVRGRVEHSARIPAEGQT